jgi:hypothetical protein
MLRRTIVVMSLVALAACEAAPTGPFAAVPLSLSRTSLTLGRNATEAVTATLGQASPASDVTAGAGWSSSNPAVVTVEGGMVRAIGLGTATVTASYRSRSASMEVIVRRNTAIGGIVAVRTVDGSQPFGTLSVLAGGSVLGALGGSDHGGVARKETRFGWLLSHDVRARSHVSPGQLSLSLLVDFDWLRSSPHTVVTEAVSYLEIFDADTGEALDRVSLAGREATVLATHSIPVSIEIKAYTQ